MKKQFIYNDKGKKVAIVVLLDEWNEMKKKLKKVKKTNEKEKVEIPLDIKKTEVNKPKKVTRAVSTKKAAPKKVATPVVKK